MTSQILMLSSAALTSTSVRSPVGLTGERRRKMAAPALAATFSLSPASAFESASSALGWAEAVTAREVTMCVTFLSKKRLTVCER